LESNIRAIPHERKGIEKKRGVLGTHELRIIPMRRLLAPHEL
jgi:hypothetical protein